MLPDLCNYPPVFKSVDMLTKLDTVRKAFAILKNTKRPKPPPVPPPAKNGTTTGGVNATVLDGNSTAATDDGSSSSGSDDSEATDDAIEPEVAEGTVPTLDPSSLQDLVR